MKNYQQGDIVYVDLNLTKGVETNKKRPCVVVSNDSYNRLLNTVIVAPISNPPKYVSDKRYIDSPLLVPVPKNSKVSGTILLQHLRSIDSEARIDSGVAIKLDREVIAEIQQVINHFFLISRGVRVILRCFYRHFLNCN